VRGRQLGSQSVGGVSTTGRRRAGLGATREDEKRRRRKCTVQGVEWECSTHICHLPSQEATDAAVYPACASLERIDLHDMSWGAALASVTVWLARIEQQLAADAEALPPSFEVVTGWGKHSRVKGTSDVKEAVVRVLAKMGSPFEPVEGNPGKFVASRAGVVSWWARMHRGAAGDGGGEVEAAAADGGGERGGDEEVRGRFLV
jgi:hypothetical protein